ncbi:MAG: hypothetical protein ACRDZ8_03280 [Acidimicrobiales bacterium]
MSSVDEDGQFATFAALLRRGQDIPDLVADLAARLERAIPEQVETERGGIRRRIERFTVSFDPQRFRIEVHGHRAVPLIDHVVRGVCVRSEEVDVDHWLDRLSRALAAEATRSTAVRLALEEALR